MRTVLIAVLIIFCNSLFNWLTNLPQDAGVDVPQGKLNSLSFAPYRDEHNPLKEIYPPVEQIDADLALLADKTHSIRTYVSTEGNMPSVPELARKHGLEMIQGVWLSDNSQKNKKEIDELIRSANANPDVVKRVMIGNEVLLRGELTVEQLVDYIRTVKKAIKQPVSYADGWHVYLQYPGIDQLIKEVDFVTMHMLPYWEDDPIPVEHIEQEADHILQIYKKVRAKIDSVAPGKPILIGETGWPSDGRQRGLAVPSVVNEAKYVRMITQLAKQNGFDYNIIEAFNQKWKSELEGVVGAKWGLFSTDRKEVFPLTGKVTENPEWYKSLFAATGLFLLVILFFWQQVRVLSLLSAAALTAFLVFAQLLSGLLVSEAKWLWITAFNEWQPLFAGFQLYYALIVIILSALMAVLLLQRAYSLLANRATLKTGAWLYALYLLFAGFAIYKTCGLVINGRYLSFHYPATYIPVMGVIYLAAIRYLAVERRFSLRAFALNDLIGKGNDNTQQDKWLGYSLLVMSLALLISEIYSFLPKGDERVHVYVELTLHDFWQAFVYTIINKQLLAWLFSLLILAVPLIANGYRKSNQ